MDTFDLHLIDQYWIDGSREPEGCTEDATSHGNLELIINGIDISGCQNENTDYGLNQSAVRLLQTIFIDNQSHDHSNPIFYHGCSVQCTCPNCIINYRVRHTDDGRVTLDRFYVTGGASDLDPKRYYDMEAEVSNTEYARKISRFAGEVLEFLPQSKGCDPYDIGSYEMLRCELRHLLELSREFIATGVISSEMQRRAGSFSLDWPLDSRSRDK
jgi:hypothetical protein